MKIIDLTEIFAKQQKLDKAIAERHLAHLTGNETPTSNQILALLVELAEFANEGKEFKYWSTKKNHIDRSKMLEEYIDCLHFLSTLAITYRVNPLIEYEPKGLLVKLDIIKELFQDVSGLLDLKKTSVEMVTRVVRKFMSLGNASGFSHDEIFKMYSHKNAINYQRLEQNY